MSDHEKSKDSGKAPSYNNVSHTYDNIVGHICTAHSSQDEESYMYRDTFLVQNQDQSIVSSNVSYQNGIKYVLKITTQLRHMNS